MSKESKIEEIMDEMECNYIIGKKILDISEELNNNNYSYCKEIYDISEELDTEDYKYCEYIHYLYHTIVSVSLKDCQNIHLIVKTLGVESDIALKIYRIVENQGLTIEEAHKYLLEEEEEMDKTKSKILKEIIEQLNCSDEYCKKIYDISKELDNNDYSYCEKISNYMFDNEIFDTKLAERMYKLEQEMN